MIEAGTDSNYAEIGDQIVLRGDDKSVSAFQERARAMALDSGADAPIFGMRETITWTDDVESVVIEGGLEAAGHENFAQFGDVLLEREDGESVERFQIRARDAARVAGAEFVTFGGLRPMPTDDSDDPCGSTKENET